MRSLTLTITFVHSPSTGIDDALALARQNRSFTVVSGDQGPTYRVSYDQTNLDQYHQLWSTVGHWRGSEHRLNGLAVKYDLSREMIQCCQECLQSPDGAAYCRGGDLHQTQVGTVAPLFPCRMIPIAETNHLGWFQYGQLNRDKIFIVDKIKLRQRVNHYLEKSLASHCPMLNEEAIDQVIHKLPTRINPQEDNNWVYRQGWVKGRYQVIGVEKRQVGAGRGSTPSTERSSASEGKKPMALAASKQADAVKIADDKQRDIPGVNYQDIGGLDHVISRVRESIELPLKMPQIFERLGIVPHRGVLLYGPPGTGKTLIAKALATECKAHFVLVNGPEVISKWHGDTEANLRKIFEEARSKAPTVILFDEIDSVAPNRDSVTHNFEAV
ncbi:MAG: AAA family ATPase, partial [Bacillota bacterium]